MADPITATIAGATVLGGAYISSRNRPNPPSAPNIPPPPKPEDMMDVIDKIAGVKAINVKGSDGKVRRVIERLPRSPDEQRMYDEAGSLIQNAFSEIKRLYAYDPTSLVDFTPFIQSINRLNEQRGSDIAKLAQIPNFDEFVREFKDMEQTSIREQYQAMRDAKQNELAGMGYGIDSTAWANASSAIDAEESKALRGLDVRAKMAGQEFAQGDVRNRILNYNLAEEGRAGQQQAALNLLSAEEKNKAQIESKRAKAIQEQAGLFEMGERLRGKDITTALGTFAPSVGQAMYENQLGAHKVHSGSKILNYQNQLAQYENRVPRFGEIAGNALTSVGAGMMNPSSSIGKFTSGFADWLRPTHNFHDGLDSTSSKWSL